MIGLVKFTAMVGIGGLTVLGVGCMVYGVDSGTVNTIIAGIISIMSGVIGFYLGKGIEQE